MESEINIPTSKKVSCKICYIADNTGYKYSRDMDNNYHLGFSIVNGKQLYWEIIWHKSGHCTIYPKNGKSGRYVNGDTVITIHFK